MVHMCVQARQLACNYTAMSSALIQMFHIYEVWTQLQSHAEGTRQGDCLESAIGSYMHPSSVTVGALSFYIYQMWQDSDCGTISGNLWPGSHSRLGRKCGKRVPLLPAVPALLSGKALSSTVLPQSLGLTALQHGASTLVAYCVPEPCLLHLEHSTAAYVL